MTEIAVLDDDPSVRNALRRLLAGLDMQVEVFASGPDLLQALESYLPDCLILDLQMPQMNGWTVIERLRQISLTLPTVVITATDADEAEVQARLGPAAVWLRKPFEEETLLRAIRAAIRLYKPDIKGAGTAQ